MISFGISLIAICMGSNIGLSIFEFLLNFQSMYVQFVYLQHTIEKCIPPINKKKNENSSSKQYFLDDPQTIFIFSIFLKISLFP